MSDNGQQHPVLTALQRMNPGRVKQLENTIGLQTQLLVQRALSDARDLANTLHILTEQATMGNANARQSLKLLFDNWEAAKAAGAGITLPRRT